MNCGKLGTLYSRDLNGKEDTLSYGITCFGYLLAHGVTLMKDFADSIELHCDHTGAKLVASTLRQFDGSIIKDHFKIEFKY